MKTLFSKQFLILFIAVTFTFNLKAYEFCGVEFLRVIDGDTIKVRLPGVHPLFGSNISVRLIGIDAPERKEKGYKVAKDFVTLKLESPNHIRLYACSKLDSFGRMLCKVETSTTKDLGEELINAGMAKVYK